MNDEQFTKLFKYIEKRFDSVDRRFDSVDKKIVEVEGAVAELAGQLRDYHQELILTSRKVDRLERWLLQVAQETGVKLDFAD